MRGGGATFVMVLALICTWGCGEPAPPPSIEGSTGAASSSSGAAESSSGVMAGPPVSLVRAEGWELTDAADDPFPGERPDFVQCEIGWDVETGAFEVSTDLCTYGSFSQRSLAEIHEGDVLVLCCDGLTGMIGLAIWLPLVIGSIGSQVTPRDRTRAGAIDFGGERRR